MALVARHLDANGIPTVMLCSARDITASACPPRALFVHYPPGNTSGRPFDPENQRELLGRALDVLESATEGGRIVDTPFAWLDRAGARDDSWVERVYEERY